MKNCPICNGKINKEKKEIEYTYKEHKKEITQSGEYCTNCGEGFLSPIDLKSNKRDIANFKRKVDNLLSTDDIKRIRKRTKLSQAQAGDIFGGGIRAFHKYETGEITQSKPLDILLRLFDKNKISINDLQHK